MSVLKLVSCGTCQSLLEIKATIATILIKFDNLSPACNDGKETSVACSEFFFFCLFSPSRRRYGCAERYNAKEFSYQTIAPENRLFDGKRAKKIDSAGTPTETHVMWSAVYSHHNDFTSAPSNILFIDNTFLRCRSELKLRNI